jgi:hypothetical protein
MRNVSDKSCRINQNTLLMFETFPENYTVYNLQIQYVVVELERLQMTI